MEVEVIEELAEETLDKIMKLVLSAYTSVSLSLTHDRLRH